MTTLPYQIALPDDASSVGYRETGPFRWEQIFRSALKQFTGTEREFVAAGHGYAYVQTSSYARLVVNI